jgi:hypothetical protein
MPSDRRSWLRRQRPQASVEAAPEVVAEEMEAATQRLRDQAWKINATTKTPMIIESHEAAAETASDLSAES